MSAQLDPATDSPPVTVDLSAGTPVSRPLRLVELVLVVGTAFALSLYSSLVHFITDSYGSNGDPYLGIIGQLCALGLLVYVLHRQGRSLRQLGLTFTWTDVPISIVLALGSYGSRYLIRLALAHGYHVLTGNLLDTRSKVGNTVFSSTAVIGSLIYICINPFKEELIVRGYLMTEAEFLTRSGLAAVVISVLLQSTYHLYQGPIPAFLHCFGFLVYAVYYQRTRRLTPIVLAHLYLDLWAWIAGAMAATAGK